MKLIDLFREWDEDGNGAVDKKEFRKAVAALVRRGPPPSRFFASLPTRARQTRRAEFARVRHRMRRPHACAPVALP